MQYCAKHQSVVEHATIDRQAAVEKDGRRGVGERRAREKEKLKHK